MTSVERWEALAARGCLCGTDEPVPCPIHTGPSDNRGIRAWFEAGMPEGFPFPSTCAICGAPGLTYPNVILDDPDGDMGEARRKRTLICPRCSTPALEARMVAEVLEAGRHQLNDQRVFVGAAA